ncbi:MAG: amino acid permease C-terminal domain-containing protein [Thermoanaerobaculum sp.]
MRWTRPELPRPFRVPLFPVIPALGVLLCLYLMVSLPGMTWLRFLGWLVVGLFVYTTFGRKRSVLNRH